MMHNVLYPKLVRMPSLCSNFSIFKHPPPLIGKPSRGLFIVPLSPLLLLSIREIYTYRFIREAGLSRVDLLPYNPSAGAKHEWLDLPYEIEGEPQDSERLARFVHIGLEESVDARIG